MDKINRSRRIHYLLQFIPTELDPRVGLYFGEHVVRVSGQLCLVVTLDGDVGVRGARADFKAELAAACGGDRHWVAHGRVYDHWYLLPADWPLNRPPVPDWIARAAEGAAALAQSGNRRPG